MHLILSVPGLSWLDTHDGGEVARELSLPALTTLLGRGTLDLAERPLSALIGQPFGLDGLPLASVAAALDGLDTRERHCLLADPVTWRIDRDRALLADAGVMRLDQAEADALVAALNQHFAADDLQFHAPTPSRWYLSLPEPVQAHCYSLPDVVGENVDDFLPQGPDALRLGRLLNEVQMLLFTHPVNEAREARGEPRVNSLWLWGSGALPALHTPPLLYSDDPWQCLLARQCQTESQSVPWTFAAWLESAPRDNEVWVQLDRLQGPAQYRDAWGWREQVQQLEQDWFAPLLQALRTGQLRQLTLLSCGERSLQVRIRRVDLWKFWRRPRALTSLY
ncbi:MULTISPECIES: hypothetical protein [unclassified Paludibacterium]|uniref:hypothetical protein n=1 Tax=unclassified Paludibacterium TaxID=2618429 RepID=UPI001C049638|nr:hypothetical protein [Paludibacterium sp. B53371]BEV71134.1 hypothetical protein THUN1379_06160 [Paludibacterium sp. THUN1379]